jgi:hypothetical protein
MYAETEKQPTVGIDLISLRELAPEPTPTLLIVSCSLAVVKTSLIMKREMIMKITAMQNSRSW